MSRNKYQKILRAFFNSRGGDPFEATKGQSEIFRLVYEPAYKRVAITAATQYGKSDVTSMALILSAIQRPEKILLVAPSEKQAGIIMGYVIDHIFDNKLFLSLLEYEEALERLKRERSKKRITFKNGGEIMVLTANVGTVSKQSKDVMGFGGTMLVADEAALIPDTMFSKILRMVGGTNGKLVKISNPWERNHFDKSLNSDKYHSIVIDWRQAVAEGRLTQEFVDEARENMPELDFQVFYESRTPETGPEDSLIPISWIEAAAANSEHIPGLKQVGVDIARFGRDKNIYCFRDGNKLMRVETKEKSNLMEVSGWVEGLIEQDKPERVGIDIIGVGSGVYDRLNERNLEPQLIEVIAGESAQDSERFYNSRAEMYWNLRELMQPDQDGQSQICIPDDPELKRELYEIRYKYASDRKIRIEAKEELKKRLGRSPDKADALAIAFADLTAREGELYIG